MVHHLVGNLPAMIWKHLSQTDGLVHVHWIVIKVASVIKASTEIISRANV